MTTLQVAGDWLVTGSMEIPVHEVSGWNPAREQGIGRSRTCRWPNEMHPMLNVEAIFQGYEAIRTRLPGMPTTREMADISTILDITDHIDAFVFDAFGVLNIGERLIEAADRRLEDLRARDVAIRVRIAAHDGILSRGFFEGVSTITLLAGTITEIRPGHGPVALVTLDVGDERLTARITRRSVEAMGLAAGQTCHAVIKTVAVAPEDVGTGRIQEAAE